MNVVSCVPYCEMNFLTLPYGRKSFYVLCTVQCTYIRGKFLIRAISASPHTLFSLHPRTILAVPPFRFHQCSLIFYPPSPPLLLLLLFFIFYYYFRFSFTCLCCMTIVFFIYTYLCDVYMSYIYYMYNRVFAIFRQLFILITKKSKFYSF